MSDIFISYSRHDADVVNELVDSLEQEGYSIWIDRVGIESGEDFKQVILKAIKESRVVLYFSSEHSNVSDWTAKEIGVAVKYKKYIVPVKLDNSNFNEAVEFDLINLDYVDYSKMSIRTTMREKLLKTLRKKIGNGNKNAAERKNLEGGRMTEQDKRKAEQERRKCERAKAQPKVTREGYSTGNSNPKPKPKRGAWIGLGVIALMVLLLLLALPKEHNSNLYSEYDEKYYANGNETYTITQTQSQAEEEEWMNAQAAREEEEAYANCVTIADCDDYLQKYPYGSFVEGVLAMRTELQRNQGGEVSNYDGIDPISNSNVVNNTNNSNISINSNNGVSYSIRSSSSQIDIALNGVSFVMKKVEGGTFLMGSNDSEADSDEGPVHSVTVSPFYIGETEVTQALWKAVMGNNPSKFKGDNLPVECVNWYDCQEFLLQLNSMTGMSFRLPTEAEWEFAARGGNKSNGYKYAGSNLVGDVAWYGENSGGKTHVVKGKLPNELGLYDMSGNIEEWCSDWYGYYGSGAQTNPTGPYDGVFRVIRGSSWWYINNNYVSLCRVSCRGNGDPSERDFNFGLRLVLPK